MPQPLTPTSSQEIVAISPPRAYISSAASSSKFSREKISRSRARSTSPKINDNDRTVASSSKAKGKRKAAIDNENEENGNESKRSRERVTEQMMSTLGNSSNPITNSDLYSRTDHFISCATGHQQSNRGGGSAGAAPYWKVRTEKMIEQSREGRTSILAGCLFYINGSTGPKVSNLQLQHLITSNGGRFSPVQSSHCTHVIANNLSGTKAQKWINGQGGRGAAKRPKVVRVEWVLDSVEQGIKLSEAGYTVIHDPSQPNLFNTLGVKPKLNGEQGKSSTSASLDL